jgi:hypothetical protein
MDASRQESPCVVIGLRLLIAGLVALWPLVVFSCPACLGPGVPQLTLVQRLIDSDLIVIANASTRQAGWVVVETVIQGDLQKGAKFEIPREELPALGFEETDRFLLGRQKLGLRWKQLGVVALGSEAWLRQLAALKRTSELTEADWVERVRFFLPDLDHSDSMISVTAFGEIARAPYAAMRSNRELLDEERLLESWRSEDLPPERRHLSVLLLGICGGEDFESFIDERLSILDRTRETQGLAAWLVAKLEQAGPSGLPEIQQRYLLDPQRTESERLAAFLAISIHGNANPEVFREPAVAIYQTAIEAGQVNVVMIDDLTRWSRHEFRAALQKHLEKRDTDNPLRNALRAYLFGTDD